MDITVSEISTAVNKALNWLRLGMVPTGTIIVGLYTEPPEGFIAFKKTSKILKSDYPALCEILFKLEAFKGDGLTYATIPDVDHRVLEMCSNVSEVGQLIEAGLPDITGYTVGALIRNGSQSNQCNGAFSYLESNDGLIQGGGRGFWASVLQFHASRSNATYKGSTFQVSGLRLLAIIKA